MQAAKLVAPHKTSTAYAPALICLEVAATTRDGGKPCTMTLCDYASAGLSGQTFSTWLPVTFASEPPTATFTRANTLRRFVVGGAAAAESLGAEEPEVCGFCEDTQALRVRP